MTHSGLLLYTGINILKTIFKKFVFKIKSKFLLTLLFHPDFKIFVGMHKPPYPESNKVMTFLMNTDSV